MLRSQASSKDKLKYTQSHQKMYNRLMPILNNGITALSELILFAKCSQAKFTPQWHSSMILQSINQLMALLWVTEANA